MFKQILLLTAISGLVTACGGGSSGGSHGGSNGGSNGGQQPAAAQLIINTKNMDYLSILQGERSSSSVFDQQNLADISNNQLTIKPTDASKKMSVLAQCEGSSQEKYVYAFDLVVTTERALPLDCASLQVPSSKHNLAISDSVSSNLHRTGYVVGGMDVYRGSSWTKGHYFIPLNTRANARAVWALSYNSTQQGYQLYKDNSVSFNGTEAVAPAQRAFNPSAGSPLLDVVNTPSSSYGLNFYSPARFTQSLPMKSDVTNRAALIASDDLQDGDYYIEKFNANNNSDKINYEHKTRTPKGSEYFGVDGIYNGGTGSLATYYWDDMQINFNNNLELEGDVEFRGVSALLTYQGQNGYFYLQHYSEDALVVLSNLSAVTDGQSLTNTMSALVDYPYEQLMTIEALYDNGVEGAGRVSAKTTVKLLGK